MAINNYIINIRFVANIKLIIMSYILRIMIDALLTIHWVIQSPLRGIELRWIPTKKYKSSDFPESLVK